VSLPSENRSVAVYRRLVGAYPRSFRARYEEAVVAAFALELARAQRRGSRRALAAFWTFMLVDLVASLGMTHLSAARRRLGYGARLIRESSGFTAALATLIIVPVWAWSRFATDDGTHTRAVALSFCVSAVAAAVSWAVSRMICVSYGVRRVRSWVHYASVRRARVLAAFAKVSLTTLVVASATELRHGRVSEVFVNQAVSFAFWASLVAALTALIALYFALDKLLQYCGRCARPVSEPWRRRMVR